MSSAPFTPEQEARLREIVREEGAASRSLGLTCIGTEGPEAILPLVRDGEGLIVHTPIGGAPRKIKGTPGGAR